jgi:hypothetical protein
VRGFEPARGTIRLLYRAGGGVIVALGGGTPVIAKPAAPEKIIGAVKFVLSPEIRDIIVMSQRLKPDSEKLERMDRVISEGEQRILRMRASIEQLARSSADTSAAQQVLVTMTDILNGMRAHIEMSAQLTSVRLTEHCCQ